MIPSYDDLTPGIPDEIDPKSAEQIALFLQTDLHTRSGDQETSNTKYNTAELLNSYLYACLRGSNRAALLAVACDFSPRVRVVSESEVLLDVSGLGALIGPPARIEEELRRALKDAGARASVAIAETQTVARLLADDVCTLRHKAHKAHEDHETLCDLCDHRGLCAGACTRRSWSHLPVQSLRELEIVAPAMNVRDRERPYEIFEKWGIATLGELAALPPAELSSRLGRRGVALHRLARGLDARPFVPDGDTPRFIERLELEWPLDALEPLSFVFARLLDSLSLALERADRGAVAIRLDLRLTDRSVHQRILQLPAPMRDAKVLRTLLLLDLESHPPSAAVDIVTIELDPAPARITQFSLLQRALPSPETLSTLIARLSALVGEARIGSPALRDSHRPDAFSMTEYRPESVGAEGASGAKGANGALVLRRQRVPLAIRVTVDQQRPVYVAAPKRGMPQGAVLQGAGPWRTSGDWWTRVWNHDEWDVALTDGAVCRIFQDRMTQCWFLAGVYD